jgi:integrase
MASVIKVQRKTRAGLTPDGKPIWKRAAGVLWYGKVKTLQGQWVQVPTHQPSKTMALKWAANECACDRCGGAERIRRRHEEAATKAQAVDEAKRRKMCGELMDEWSPTLTNRSAKDDRSRLAKHIRPYFAHLQPSEVKLPTVMQWIDKMRATTLSATTIDKDGQPKPSRGRKRASVDGKLSDATTRHAMNLLSRFFSWCVERGHTEINPVRQIPTGKRPHQSGKKERPWVNDDKVVRDLMNGLAPPFREMFYLGNRSGLRPGEQRGLRMSDFDDLDQGSIRVRFSDLGCLKEDKKCEGKSKRVPAPDDAGAVIGPWLAMRTAQGAQPEDLVFMPELTRGALKQRCEEAWREAADALGLKLDYYEATRHSFVSRNLAAGASLDEVSAAIGHSSPVVTRRYYDHFIRKTFSAGLRAGIGATGNTDAAPVVQLHKSKAIG